MFKAIHFTVTVLWAGCQGKKHDYGYNFFLLYWSNRTAMPAYNKNAIKKKTATIMFYNYNICVWIPVMKKIRLYFLVGTHSL